MTNQELKDVLSFGFGIASLIDTAVHGLSFTEIPEVISILQGAKKTEGELKQALGEYLALDAPGRADVDSFIAQNCVLPGAGAEAIAKAVLILAIDAQSVAALIKKPA